MFHCFRWKQTYRTKATPYLHDGLLYFLTHLERSEDEHIYIYMYTK